MIVPGDALRKELRQAACHNEALAWMQRFF